jgi:hypothetical protein
VSATRTQKEIRAELTALSEQRAALWRELSQGYDGKRAAEAKRLSASIDDLWRELRSAAASARFGPREGVLDRARADVRLERELNLRLASRRRVATR